MAKPAIGQERPEYRAVPADLKSVAESGCMSHLVRTMNPKRDMHAMPDDRADPWQAVRLRESTVRRLDALCEAERRSRPQQIAVLVERALDPHPAAEEPA